MWCLGCWPGALVSGAVVACVEDPGKDGVGREGGGSSHTPGALPGAACVNIQLISWCFFVHFLQRSVVPPSEFSQSL